MSDNRHEIVATDDLYNNWYDTKTCHRAGDTPWVDQSTQTGHDKW